MLKIIGFILLLALLAVGISFSSLNATPVQLNYYFGSGEVHLALALIIALAIGAAFGLLGNISAILKQKRQILKLRKSVKSAESELTHLRTVAASKE
ncbi:lipopolysaccharide assembly protein LapA domain-containing protein [Pseudomonadota bacterium]